MESDPSIVVHKCNPTTAGPIDPVNSVEAIDMHDGVYTVEYEDGTRKRRQIKSTMICLVCGCWIVLAKKRWLNLNRQSGVGRYG